LETTEIVYKTDLANIDWSALKQTLLEDDFDNGRTPDQLRRSFENSYAYCFACVGDQIVGKVRVLSDGVCNAYIVDVWTYTPYQKQGIARHMMETVFQRLTGQHVYLFTDSAVGLYEKLGFEAQGIGMGRVVGQWLVNE
jgi:ribosomal protein S18 acetylase RimI-like enzyme